MFRREAACEIIRSGTSSSTPTTRAAIAGSVRQPIADGAEQRHVGLDRDLGELRQRLDDGLEVAAIVHGHRHADFRRRDHVHGGPEALEHLEHAPQEPVRHQHAGRGDVDDRHLALGGQRRSSGVRLGAPARR